MKNYKQIFLTYLTFVQTMLVVNSVEASAEAQRTAYLEDMSLGCTGDLSNYYFNLNGLKRDINL